MISDIASLNPLKLSLKVNYLKAMCNKDLLKLSLCWICSKYMVNKYKTIEESINKHNGKYYFLVDIKI